jgi:ABC-type iron transport system FetAB ATPase subunit
MAKRFKVSELRYGGFGPVSFALQAGERIGVTGPSGCGKTRLLRALADLDPWQGEIQLDERAPDATPASAWRKKVAYLPAESQWWFDDVGAHFAVPPDAEEACALGLDPAVLSWPVARLSSGEKQRLGLLRTLASRPAVLLLDEPTAHLDAERERAFEALVARRCETDGLMAVWVAHNPEQLQRITWRGYRMAARGVWTEVASWT